MKKTSSCLLIPLTVLTVLTVFIAGCGGKKSALKFSTGTEHEVVVIQSNPVKEDPAWVSMKKDLFEMSCTKCHNPDTAKRKKRLDLTQKEVVTSHYDDILYRMTDAFDTGMDYMPPKGAQVTPDVIKEFRNWYADAEFANLQKKLFEVSCLKCHGPTQTKHSNLSSKEVVLEKFDEIVYKMTKAFDENNKPMPPPSKGSKVSAELIKELQDWKTKAK